MTLRDRDIVRDALAWIGVLTVTAAGLAVIGGTV